MGHYWLIVNWFETGAICDHRRHIQFGVRNYCYLIVINTNNWKKSYIIYNNNNKFSPLYPIPSWNYWVNMCSSIKKKMYRNHTNNCLNRYNRMTVDAHENLRCSQVDQSESRIPSDPISIRSDYIGFLETETHRNPSDTIPIKSDNFQSSDPIGAKKCTLV